LHSSPLVQALSAEAFTSGRHVVFAPGRLETGTARGLALLGHELTHIGQPLAFKTGSSAPPVEDDSQELAARRQEEQIQQVYEKGWPSSPGWPESPRMELHHAPPAVARTSQVTMLQRAVEINEVQAEVAQPQRPAAEQVGTQAPAQSGGAPGAAQTQAGPNVDALASQVYSILKNRLRAERDRHQLYGL
jgi:hypothetical protein